MAAHRITQSLLGLALGVGLLATVVGAADAEAIRAYTMPGRLATAPVLDGLLQDSCWADALVVDAFVPFGGKAAPDAREAATRALLTYDADALYIGFDCREPLIDRLVTSVRAHDGPTWMDDSVEIFLDPGGDRLGFVQLVFNADGVLMDGIRPTLLVALDRDWETGAEAAAAKHAAGWSLECRIPFAGLPSCRPEGTWTFHLARNRRAAGAHVTSLQTPISGFHEVAAFDLLHGIALPERCVMVTRVLPGEGYRGTNLARVSLHNAGSQESPVRVALAIADAAGAAAEPAADAALAVPAGATVEAVVRWPGPAPERGPFKTILSVSSPDRLLHRSVHTHPAVPDVIGPVSRRVWLVEPHAPVRLEFPIRIGEGSRAADLPLVWQAFDAGGMQVGQGRTSVRGSDAVLRLFWNAWYDGRYTLHLELGKDGAPLATSAVTLRFVQSPWGE